MQNLANELRGKNGHGDSVNRSDKRDRSRCVTLVPLVERGFVLADVGSTPES